MRAITGWAAAALAAAACGTTTPSGAGGAGAGDDTARSETAGGAADGSSWESIAGIGLPELPMAQQAMSGELREGWRAAERTLRMDPPEAPRGGTVAEHTEWARERMNPWLERKVKSLRSARERLVRAARSGPEPRAVAVTLVALMYEQLALQVAQMPAPAELERDPALAAHYRNALLDKAESLLAQARQGFEMCNEQQGSQLVRWRRLCRERREAMDERWAALREAGSRDASGASTGSSARVTPGEGAARSGRTLDDVLRRRPDSGPPPPGPEACWATPDSSSEEQDAEERDAEEQEEGDTKPTATRIVLAPSDVESVQTGDAPLLGEERDTIMQAVRAKLARRLELDVAPLGVTERRLRAWRSQRPRPGAPRCGRRPFRRNVVAGRDALAGRVRATCGADGCSLSVRMLSPHARRPEGVPFVLSASVRGDPLSVEAWTDAAERLAPPPKRSMLLGALGGSGEQSYEALADPIVRTYGAWQGSGAARETLVAAKGELVECLRHEPHPIDDYGYVLDVGEDGAVAALFPDDARGADDARMHRCVRRALESVEFAGGAQGLRRAVVSLHFDRPASGPRDAYGVRDHETGVRVRLRPIRTGHAAIDRGARSEERRVRAALAACYADRFEGQGPTTAHRVAIEIGARGRARGVELEPFGRWAEEGAASRSVTRCLERALRDTRWACPTSGRRATVETVMCMHRPGAD